jgi:hypothetical protein
VSAALERDRLVFSGPLSSGTTFALFDSRGRVVARQSAHGAQTVRLRTPSAQGVYFWIVKGPDLCRSGKHVVQR